MIKKFALTLAAIAFSAGLAAADPINGNWTTNEGNTASITGGGPFTITLKSGPNAGKRIGSFSASGPGKYAGTIVEPKSGKSYKGKAALAGKTLKMSGCVAGGLICRTVNWSKQ